MHRNLKVLVMEPANQQLSTDTARPNGALGPAFLVGALRAHDIEADYLDATVGLPSDSLEETFFNRMEQENGNIRYGMSAAAMAKVFAKYDVIATSSIFSAQTRLHLEAARIAKQVADERGREILVISGGVNARAMREVFLSNHFDVIALAEGEKVIVQIVDAFSRGDRSFSGIHGISYRDSSRTILQPVFSESKTVEMKDLPFPAFDAMPLDRYQQIGIPHAGVLPKGMKYAAIQTSRGCQDRCTFCHISLEKQQTDLLGSVGFLRMFSLDRVRQEVDRAVALGVNRLYFEDDNLFFNKKRLTELAPMLRRDGLEYSNVNGANLRFLFKRDEQGRNIVDTEFIEMLAGFGLKELVMPFESRNLDILQKYASGKFNPDMMDPILIVKALKKAGIRLSGNFMIGFRDESWDSILRTKEYARVLLDAGLDAVGFMIPVPYPGSGDFEAAMQNSDSKEEFNKDPLRFTDRMHWRAKPLFPTIVSGEKLVDAVQEFWLELNRSTYKQEKLSQNVRI